MKISRFSPAQLAEILRNEGLFLKIGPLIIHFRSEVAAAAVGIHCLYADFERLDRTDFADFHIGVAFSQGIRGWARRQVRFLHDQQPLFQPLPARLAFPFFEWGTNWCISRHANQFLIIHSAVLERNGRTIFLTARPGGGKSTLCAGLVHRGWRLFSDEFALVRIWDGLVSPVPRPVALKNESIALIRSYSPGAVFGPKYSSIEGETLAHMRPPPDSVHRSDETAVPGLVLFVDYAAGSGVTLSPVESSVAFLRLADNAFNYSLLGATGFETLAGVVESSSCYELCYGDLNSAIEEIHTLEPPVLKGCGTA